MGLHWKRVHSFIVFQKLQFYQLFFLWFVNFCKLDHGAGSLGGTVD